MRAVRSYSGIKQGDEEMTVPILTSSMAVLMKAGKNVSSDIINGVTSAGASCSQIMNEFINQAESEVIVASRKNWIDDYSSLNADKKKLLDQVTSDLAAMYCINYDMSGYTSKAEAETMLDLLKDASQRGLTTLKEQVSVDWTGAG